MAKVEIVMATYNGENYVKSQLDSILNQSFTDFHITVSDDHSTDSTYEILKEYERSFPDKITVSKPDKRFGNARDHFYYLLKKADADYYFFSDQDDYWFKDKIELFMNRFKDGDENIPLLVFSDQSITDSALNVLSPSIMEYQRQYTDIKSYKELVFQNVVTGGASAINRKLRDKVLECTNLEESYMHDHFIAIIAALFGECLYIDKPTSYYRQHSANEVGAKNTGSLKYVLKQFSNLKKVREKLLIDKKQAALVLRTYQNDLSEGDREFFKTYCKNHSGIIFFIKNKKYLHGFFRLIGNIILG